MMSVPSTGTGVGQDPLPNTKLNRPSCTSSALCSAIKETLSPEHRCNLCLGGRLGGFVGEICVWDLLALSRVPPSG